MKTERGRFEPGVRLEDEARPDALVFAFRERKLLVHEKADVAEVPGLAEINRLAAGDDAFGLLRRLFLGTLDGRQVFAAELAGGAEAPDGMAFHGLRGLGLLARLDEMLFTLAGRAIQIVDWDRDHQFCGRCATATDDDPAERVKRCPSCGLVSYPRLAPAVIVLVERGREVLLARSPHFPPGVFSTIAGFVEPGETLEEAVAREIAEEVGVRVDEIRYFGSQPWPFPNSLMIGFKASWESGEITLDDPEIEDAGWFTAGALPKIPPKLSIARALIDSWRRQQRG